MKRLRTVVGIFAMVIGTLLATSGVSHATTTDAPYAVAVMQNVDTKMCMDVASWAPRTPVIQVPCYHKRYTSQDWEIVGNLWTGFNLHNMANKDQAMCVDIGVVATKAPIFIWPCQFGDGYRSQKFRLRPDNKIVSLGTGFCLDVGSLQGTAVHLYPCSTTPSTSQTWTAFLYIGPY